MSQPTLQETVVTFDELAAKRMGRIRRYLRTHPRLVVIVAEDLLAAARDFVGKVKDYLDKWAQQQ